MSNCLTAGARRHGVPDQRAVADRGHARSPRGDFKEFLVQRPRDEGRLYLEIRTRRERAESEGPDPDLGEIDDLGRSNPGPRFQLVPGVKAIRK